MGKQDINTLIKERDSLVNKLTLAANQHQPTKMLCAIDTQLTEVKFKIEKLSKCEMSVSTVVCDESTKNYQRKLVNEYIIFSQKLKTINPLSVEVIPTLKRFQELSKLLNNK